MAVPAKKEEYAILLRDGLHVKLSKDPKVIRKQALAIKDFVDRGFFIMAKILYHIHSSDPPLWIKWGFNSWTDYIEQEIGWSVRRAQYLISIYHWFAIEIKNKSVIEKVSQLGWSYTKEMVGIVTEKNVDKWVDKAKQMTVPQFAEACRVYLSKETGEEVGTVSRVTFTLYDDQADTVAEALESARITSGSEVRSHNLSLICLDYLSSSPGSDLKERAVMIVKRLESTYGLKFVVIDPNKDKILYKSKGVA